MSLSSAYISTPAYKMGQVPQTNDRLYFARNIVEVIPFQNKEAELESTAIVFKSAHIGLKVLVRGLDETEHQLLLTDLAPYNDFNMSYLKTDLITYQPLQTANTIVSPYTGQLYELDTFRFENENPIQVCLVDPNTKTDLIEPIILKDILAQQNLSIEDTQEVTLLLEIEYNNSNVSIDIKPWKDVETFPSN